MSYSDFVCLNEQRTMHMYVVQDSPLIIIYSKATVQFVYYASAQTTSNNASSP